MFRAPLCPLSGAREYYTDGCCLWYLVLENLKTKASNKICNKNHLLHLVGILFPQQFHEELLLDCPRTVQTLTLRNSGTYIPNDTASYSRKQLRDTQISQETVLLPHGLHGALSPELQGTPYRHYSARLVNCTNHTLPRCHGTHPRHTATPIVPIFSRRAR